MRNLQKNNWLTSEADIFWGELAPCDHVVQIYETDREFINILSGFVQGGIFSKEGVIIIATKEHIKSLELNLIQKGIDIHSYQDKHYFPIEAQSLLNTFMVNGWPDEKLFSTAVSALLKRVRLTNNKVRAFGEMVAILWAQGHNGATVQLEHLWNNFCESDAFCLFCAYPKTGFTSDMTSSMEHICSSHHKIIAPENKQHSTKILYSRVHQKKAG